MVGREARDDGRLRFGRGRKAAVFIEAQRDEKRPRVAAVGAGVHASDTGIFHMTKAPK